jgi:hypothetical protein
MRTLEAGAENIYNQNADVNARCRGGRHRNLPLWNPAAVHESWSWNFGVLSVGRGCNNSVKERRGKEAGAWLRGFCVHGFIYSFWRRRWSAKARLFQLETSRGLFLRYRCIIDTPEAFCLSTRVQLMAVRRATRAREFTAISLMSNCLLDVHGSTLCPRSCPREFFPKVS